MGSPLSFVYFSRKNYGFKIVEKYTKTIPKKKVKRDKIIVSSIIYLIIASLTVSALFWGSIRDKRAEQAAQSENSVILDKLLIRTVPEVKTNTNGIVITNQTLVIPGIDEP